MIVGASGFVGKAVVDLMVSKGIEGTAVSRTGGETGRPVRVARVDSYEDVERLSKLGVGCGAVIMLAGRAHILKHGKDDIAAFMQANQTLPVAVAETAAKAGISRYVFVSSIAVHGPARSDQPLRESDHAEPATDYGRSKLAGEKALARRCHDLGLELVIVRPPLVYGPGAPGNFGALLRAARRGVPLPLGSIRNRRDFIGVENLADMLLCASMHRAAPGETFLVSDGEETSTAAVARILYAVHGHEKRVFPFPPALLRVGALALRRPEVADRLLEDLRIDSSHLRNTLQWRAPLTLAEGLARSVGPSS